MIVLVHDSKKAVQLLNSELEPLDININSCIVTAFIEASKQFPDTLLIWCHKAYVPHIDMNALPSIFHHQRILASYNPLQAHYLPNQIGYIDHAFFIKTNKTVTYPTWLTSSSIGGVNTKIITHLEPFLVANTNFDYFLNSLTKRAMVDGLFCYSEPKLLKNGTFPIIDIEQASDYHLFMFVKQHYKWVWVFFLATCFLIYEKKIKLFPLIKSLFYKQLTTSLHLDAITVQSRKKVVDSKTIDVIIPTIGRKKYLYDVLKDLAAQTVLPKNVIIVEQNPLEGSESELDYLQAEDWPFTIKHTFTHTTGVVNARNLALKQVESEWTLLGDDDNRFDINLIETLFNHIKQYGVTVGTTVYIQPKEVQTYLKTTQTSIFGAGNSIIKSTLIKKVKFNMKYEFNYGEDNEFGMQLRHIGEDVVFFADIKITHLKAPVGGYRTKVKQLWADDAIPPKPSPTIQLLYQTYFTPQQLLGYKLLLGSRNYKNRTSNNPISYIKLYRKQWERSILWSATLMKQSDEN